ncbi:MAG: HAD-IA family hydrolase [Planctomycetota bacterium]|nr:HAD-IA family hydrolase [Planctomycetota bacterium]
MNCSVVCLDAADTLFSEREERAALYTEAFAHFKMAAPAPLMAQWMKEVHEEMPAHWEEEPRYSRPWFREFVGRLIHRTGESFDPEPVRAYLEETFTDPSRYVVFSDTFPALDDLSQAGYRLALISNWSDRLEGLLNALGLASYFEVLAVSAVVGIDKPAPGLFQYALDALDVHPGHALHVGNDPCNDLEGALSAGMEALLLDRTTQSKPAPSHVITSLLDIPKRLTES